MTVEPEAERRVPGPEGDATVQSVMQRLGAIVQAVDGREAGANGDELWFETPAARGLQVRLCGQMQGPCYDRSANFAISYGGRAEGESADAAFRQVVERIKAIDDTPIAGAASAFRAASLAVARRYTPDSVEDRAAYRARARQNVPFLDLCADLVGGDPRRLAPLHFGFWPADAAVRAAVGEAYDPFDEFSHNLLTHVPPAAMRILDVGCGLGANTKLLSERGKRVTALSPVAHHCAAIRAAGLARVDVTCARFEDVAPGEPYDLLLFSESVNHFPWDAAFLERCKAFLVESGHMLIADDLTMERASSIETQPIFRLLRSVDITPNIAPTTDWWARHLTVFAAYHKALLTTLELEDAALATRVREVLAGLEHSDLKILLSGQLAPPALKGRYMIYLLQRD